MNFLTKYKNYFLIAGFVVVIIAWGYLIYFLFFRSTTQPGISETPATEGPGFSSVLPETTDGPQNIIEEIKNNGKLQVTIPTGSIKPDDIAKGGITNVTKLTNTKVSGITTNQTGNSIQYYNETEGIFYTVDKNGKKVKLSDKQFYNVDEVTWSPKKNKAVIEYPDGSNIVYDFDKERQVTLPKHWEEFEFSDNGEKIVMKSIGLDPNNRWLAITNDDGSKSEKVTSIGINANNIIPSWSPNNQIVAMEKQGIDFNRQEIFFIGLNNENFKSTVIEGRGFEHTWSPEGNRLLYSVYSTETNLKPNLWVVDAQGESIGNRKTDLKLETWAHKCSFSGASSLYCSVPTGLEEGAGVFPELSRETSDLLFKIDTNTGLRRLIAIPNGSYNISQLVISENEEEAYFTDEITGELHMIKLK